MTPFEIADALRACLESTFTGDTGKPAEICHRPGDIAPLNIGTDQDECCTGLGWVRVVTVEPVVEPGATETADYNPCDIYRLRVTLEMGVARCNPVGTRSAGPTCEQWTELAFRMDQDRAVMRRAVCCLQAETGAGPEEDPYLVLAGPWLPLESSGGCAGGTLTVTVYTDCNECGS